jgi:hypothetical protein
VRNSAWDGVGAFGDATDGGAQLGKVI